MNTTQSMKFTLDNMLDSSIAPDSFDYDFGWVRYIMRNRADPNFDMHCIIFTSMSFFIEFETRRRSLSTKESRRELVKQVLKSPNWKPFVKELHKRVDEITKTHLNFKSTCVSGNTENELAAEIQAKGIQDLVPNFGTMHVYEFEYFDSTNS